MQWLGIVIFVILAIFVTWLVIDTIIYVVKKVKDKKKKQKVDVIDNETTSEQALYIGVRKD